MHSVQYLVYASLMFLSNSFVHAVSTPQDASSTSIGVGNCAIVQNVTDAPDTINCFPQQQGTASCTLNANFFDDGTNYFEIQDFNCTRHWKSSGCITAAVPSGGVNIVPLFSDKSVTILEIPKADAFGRYNPDDGFTFGFTGSNSMQISYSDPLDFTKASNSNYGVWMDFDGLQSNRINQRNVECRYKSSSGDMNGSYVPGKCYIIEFMCKNG